MTDERETLTYELFGTAARELAGQAADDRYEPDLILSIAGCSPPAHRAMRWT